MLYLLIAGVLLHAGSADHTFITILLPGDWHVCLFRGHYFMPNLVIQAARIAVCNSMIMPAHAYARSPLVGVFIASCLYYMGYYWPCWYLLVASCCCYRYYMQSTFVA